MAKSIIDIMKAETQTADGGLAARNITPGEWVTVGRNLDGTYRWKHSSWDVDKQHEFGDPGIQVETITEEQAAIFLYDAKDTPPQDEPDPVDES